MSRPILLHYDRTVAGIKPAGRPLTLFVSGASIFSERIERVWRRRTSNLQH